MTYPDYSRTDNFLPLVANAKNICKKYGDQMVLDHVDFSMQKGEFVALLGPSGTGKTTLLRILGGLEKPSFGKIDVAKKTSIVFQDPRLILAQKVWRNVVLADYRRPDSYPDAVRALKEVGLVTKANAWPASLSGGEAQRVGIARALYGSPELLLLDEPFSALDAFTRRKAQNLVLDLWREHEPGVLLVTHDIEEALLLADRILILGAGKIKADIQIEIPRKRDSTSQAFNDIKRRILSHLADAFS